MIYAGLFDILYPGGTFGENSCICVRTFAVAVRARGHVTFYADNVYIHYINRHVRFVPPSQRQYTLRRESQQRSNAIELAKVYSVYTSNLACHRVVVCTERNRAYSPPLSSSMSLLLLLLLLLLSPCTTSTRFKRVVVDVSVKSCVSKIHLCFALHYEPSGIVISTSSLVK